jgi:hypothetical protein
MEQLWIGTYLRYDSLAGAAFQDSPLVRTRQYLSAGVGLAWPGLAWPGLAWPGLVWPGYSQNPIRPLTSRLHRP